METGKKLPNFYMKYGKRQVIFGLVKKYSRKILFPSKLLLFPTAATKGVGRKIFRGGGGDNGKKARNKEKSQKKRPFKPFHQRGSTEKKIKKIAKNDWKIAKKTEKHHVWKSRGGHGPPCSPLPTPMATTVLTQSRCCWKQRYHRQDLLLLHLPISCPISLTLLLTRLQTVVEYIAPHPFQLLRQLE